MSKVKRRKNTKAETSSPFAVLSAYLSRYSIAAAAGVTVIGAGLIALFWAGGYFGIVYERIDRTTQTVTAAAGYDVRRVTAKGLTQTLQSDLMEAVGPIKGGSMAHVDLHDVRARVEEIGWVRSAAVTRLWPNTLHVSVREREPAAVWQIDGAFRLIDESGAVIDTVDAFEYSNLPLIVGAGAPQSVSGLLSAVRAEPAIWGAVSAFVRVGERRWNLRLKAGGDVKFPQDDFETAVEKLAQLHQAYQVLDRDIDYIDLRNPDRLIYREETGSERVLDAESR